jgi:hypothetical protein
MEATQVQRKAGFSKGNSIAKSLRRKISALLVTFALMAGLGLAVAAPSQATSSYCGSGQCTVYLDWNETVALSKGRVPSFNAGPLTVPIRTGLVGHVLIAKGWVNRGNCVAFTANVRPWANQGMLGWRCR